MSKVIPLERNSAEYKGISALNIIYEAGLDEDSRPILVLCADNLPNPDIYDYDLILSFIFARLDEFVENDYVLVFFSSPAKYRPGWFWLLRAYRSLDRKYKKNLKALYVVHLVRSYRLVFDLANKIISPKFARKLHYCSDLATLKANIDLSPEFIPQRVIDYDNQLPDMYYGTPRHVGKDDNSIALSLAFGRKLEELATEEKVETNEFIPKFVTQIVDHLRENGLDTEGIFRKSPSSDELHFVKTAFNNGEEVDLKEHDIDVSAALLKVFIRELPTPLIPQDFCERVGALPDGSICNKDTINKLRQKIDSEYADKPLQLNVLKYICHFLKEVSEHSSKNRMNVHNLAIVFTPNIIRVEHIEKKKKKGFMDVPDNQESALQDAAVYLKQMNQGMAFVSLLISRYQDIFDNA